MKRTKGVNNQSHRKPVLNEMVLTDILSRQGLSRRLGYSYGDKRKLYKALGYPEDTELTFEYYYNKYDRNEIARAVIDRPTDKTWSGDLTVVEEGELVATSELSKAWRDLDERLKVKKRLNKTDKLRQIGRFSLLLLGLDDVKVPKDFQTPATGERKLLYLRQVAESEVTVDKFVENTSDPRYGQPLLYNIKIGTIQSITSSGVTQSIKGTVKEISVHHSRIIHVVGDTLTNEIVGEPYLKSIINRLIDTEKILGGDAEMFWRGARPGYTATEKDDYQLDDVAKKALFEELDNYEHDLRRFITSTGVDIKALEQQVADPLGHLDIQLQAISGRTGIPKRILIGSERGELASSQDADAWLSLIKTRQHEEAEPNIFRPFINRCMELGILPKVAKYNVFWDDVFTPSDLDKVDVGAKRARALMEYSQSALASDILAPKLVFKYLLGLGEEEIQEAMEAMDQEALDEDRLLLKAEAAGIKDQPSQSSPAPKPVTRKRQTPKA